MRKRGDEFHTLAVTDSTPTGITHRKLLKIMKNPRLAVALLNAQLRLRGGTTVPLSVRLHGKIRMSGGGHLVLGNGITLVGNIVPIEFVWRVHGLPKDIEEVTACSGACDSRKLI